MAPGDSVSASLSMLKTAGAVYDGLILAAGQKSGATTLITCNIGHFSRLDVAGIAIMTPSDLISQQ